MPQSCLILSHAKKFLGKQLWFWDGSITHLVMDLQNDEGPVCRTTHSGPTVFSTRSRSFLSVNLGLPLPDHLPAWKMWQLMFTIFKTIFLAPAASTVLFTLSFIRVRTQTLSFHDKPTATLLTPASLFPGMTVPMQTLSRCSQSCT